MSDVETQADFFDPETLLASAASFLAEAGNREVASVLLATYTVTFDFGGLLMEVGGDGVIQLTTPILYGPSWVYQAVTAESDNGRGLRGQIVDALRAFEPHGYHIEGIWARMSLNKAREGWRSDLDPLVRGYGINNQGLVDKNVILWRGLKFRSKTEVRIADALDFAKVLFLPNCLARLNGPSGRVNREADFLVCKDGKWGILEVDGDPYHPPAMAAQDHERQRLFQLHGIKAFQRYTSKRCYETPHEVVKEFLKLLDIS